MISVMMQGTIYTFYTDLRMELIKSIDDKIEELSTPIWYNEKEGMIVFTHEGALSSKLKVSVKIKHLDILVSY